MTITYSMPTQIVTLTITPEEIRELKEDAREAIKTLFVDTVRKLKEAITPGDPHP
jgi:hypothetical protein